MRLPNYAILIIICTACAGLLIIVIGAVVGLLLGRVPPDTVGAVSLAGQSTGLGALAYVLYRVICVALGHPNEDGHPKSK